MTKTSITLNYDSQLNSTATITATIPQELVERHLNDSLHHLGEEITIKGFRKGKAPIAKVKEQVDQAKLLNHALEHIFPDILRAVFDDKKFKLSGNPTLKAVTTPDNADWTVTLDFPLIPEFELGNYQASIKKALKAAKSEEDKLKVLLDTLIAEISLVIPPSLTEQEVNHSLSRLYDQTQALGLSVDQYLKSLGKSAEELKNDYQKAAEENLKIEFILDRIASDQKVEVTEAEIDDLIKASGDGSAKKELDNPNQRLYIKGIIKKRKTIDALLKL